MKASQNIIEGKVEHSRLFWLGVLIAGTTIYIMALILANILAEDIRGAIGGVIGILILGIVIGGFSSILRIAKLQASDIGLKSNDVCQDIIIGTVIAIIIVLLEFIVVVPLTGGAERSDIIAARAIIGNTTLDLIGAIILGITVGGIVEELFFRGFMLSILPKSFSDKRIGSAIAIIFSVLIFAVLHAYQGLVGMIDQFFFALVLVGLFFWRDKRVTAPMVTHGLNNLISIIAIYLLY